MSPSTYRCWRTQRFEPEHHHVEWDELSGLFAEGSPLRNTLERVATARVPLLLTGPPGRGKRWAARAAHALAGSAGPLLEVERTGVPGAGRSLRDICGSTAEGTLVVVGLEESPERSQRELAEFLDEPPGASLMVLGERPPIDRVPDRSLRRDLGDRLFWVDVDPLRRRPRDVEAGLELFLRREARRAGTTPPQLHELARARLLGYPWPGDVAELERFAERAVVLDSVERAFAMVDARGDRSVDAAELWDSACRRLREGRPISLDRIRRRVVRQAERHWVGQVLDRVEGDTRRAAELLGVSHARIARFAPGGRR